jgi:hypothetical protein
MQHAPRRRVSIGVKRVGFVIAAAAIAALGWYLAFGRTGEDAEASEPMRVASSPGAAQPPARSAAPARPPQHVTKLASAEERARIAEQIERARSARAAIHAPAPPSLPRAQLDPKDLDSFKTTLRDAMHEVLPLLAECYTAARPRLDGSQLVVKAHLSLVGDPDVGTLIDADRLAATVELPRELDACLRDTLQKLELPPLAEGDKLTLTYPLVFRDE